MTDGPLPFDGVDAAKESDTERDGLLSYSGEWHALIIGFGVGLTGEMFLVTLFAAFLLGIGAERLRETTHLRHAAKETAYSYAGLAIGLVANIFLLGQNVISSIQ